MTLHPLAVLILQYLESLGRPAKVSEIVAATGSSWPQVGRVMPSLKEAGKVQRYPPKMWLATTLSSEPFRDPLEDYRHLFGTEPDATICQRAGVSSAYHFRQANPRLPGSPRRIAPLRGEAPGPQTRMDVDPRLLDAKELLGKVPDAQIAKDLNVSSHYVSAWRRRLKIKLVEGRKQQSRALPSWVIEARPRMGVDPDKVIAESLRVSTPAVYFWRRKLEIPSLLDKQLERIQAARSYVGTMPDAQLAKKIHVSISVLTSWRRRNKIRLMKLPLWVETEHPRLGVDSDREISERTGVPTATVAYWRRELGIRRSNTPKPPTLSGEDS